MLDYEEKVGTIQVPSNTGIEGFLRTIRLLLEKPRMQRIEIDAKGVVKYKYFAKVDDALEGQDNFGVDFKSLQPYHVIRNAEVKEFMPPPNLPAAVVAGLMFDQASVDQLNPLAFATGVSTALWDWYRYTTGAEPVSRDTFFGLPLMVDRYLPDEVLLLCAGYGKSAAFLDTRVSYKVEIPLYEQPSNNVQVIL